MSVTGHSAGQEGGAMGNIGKELEYVELEPFPETAPAEPEPERELVPVPVPVREPVPV